MNLSHTMLFYAFRYALGRMTYAPEMVMEEIRKNIKEIPQNDKNIMVEEIEEYSFGSADSGKEWKELAEELKT